MQEIRYFSMFSGIGGFELGIQKCCYKNKDLYKPTSPNRNEEGRCCQSADFGTKGFTCVGFSEIDKHAIATYQKHFPDHKNFGDATKIEPSELPNFELLCAGFPCQAFSIAGKRLGFKDTRGTLFFDIARVAKAKRPQFLFLENVKGLLNHDNGRTFTTILATLDELGYDAEWEVLNSKHFGVPQNRERLFIIGHIRGKSTRQVFPIGKGNGIFETEDGGKQGKQHRVCSTIDSRYGALRNAGETYIETKMLIHNVYGGFNEGIRNFEDYSPTIRTPKGGGHLPMVAHNSLNEAKTKIRRLTPTECERLQGFPDGWTVGSDTQRYKQLGNAVTVNVIEAIMQRMIEVNKQ